MPLLRKYVKRKCDNIKVHRVTFHSLGLKYMSVSSFTANHLATNNSKLPTLAPTGMGNRAPASTWKCCEVFCALVTNKCFRRSH